MLTILENAAVLDVDAGELRTESTIVIEGRKIKEITRGAGSNTEARRIDLRGMTLMPGLIDCHAHAMQSTSNLGLLSAESPTYAASRAFQIIGGMLRRGFTTIRDCGGADYGLAKAVAEGHVTGPRIIYCGKALTATGGHGDYRTRGQHAEDDSYWLPKISRRCEGVDELRRAVRDEVRKGAHHIKIMANGGVASPTDRVTSDQYSEEEIRAVVDEAAMAGLYVSAHTYTARSIKRAVRNGVLSVEHGNLADDEALDLIKEKGAFLVPTLIVFKALAEDGVADGLPAELVTKLGNMAECGLQVVEKAHRKAIAMAFGSDLIGNLHARQSEEFLLRADVLPAADLIRSATINGARLVRMDDQLGRIAENYEADLLAVNGNPLEDVGILAKPEERFKLIMKGGQTIKDATGDLRPTGVMASAAA